MRRTCFFGWLWLATAIGCGGSAVNETTTRDETSHLATSDDGKVKDTPQPAVDASKGTKSAAETNVVDLTVVGPNDPALRDRLAHLAVSDGHGGWRVDDETKQFLASFGTGLLPRLSPLLTDDSVDVRRGAALYLFEADMSNPQFAGAFTITLTDSDPTIRHLGLTALARMPNELVVKSAPKLAALLRRPDETAANRAQVARKLADLPDAAAAILPTVKRSAHDDPDANVRKACLYAVSKLAGAGEAVTLYSESLASDQDAGVRRVAAARLEKLGPQASTAAPRLAAALGDVNQDVRATARDALIAIGSTAVDPIVGQLASGDANTRQQALFALGQLGSAAKRALPQIKKLLADADASTRELAEEVLRHLEQLP